MAMMVVVEILMMKLPYIQELSGLVKVITHYVTVIKIVSASATVIITNGVPTAFAVEILSLVLILQN
jgi:MFS-type transporter involved in bile tolerance (Atg22 family)